jgi:hypothetical protein
MDGASPEMGPRKRAVEISLLAALLGFERRSRAVIEEHACLEPGNR